MPFAAAVTSTAPSEPGRRCELLLTWGLSILAALIQARQNGSGASNNSLDLALVAILLSLATSALHLGLHQLLRRLHLPRLLLRPATFFSVAAVVLLVTSSISGSRLKRVPIGVFVSTLFVFLCFRLIPAVFLVNRVAQLRGCKLVKSIFGPPATHAGDQVESPRNQVARLEPRLCVDQALLRMVINWGASDQFRRLASRQHRPDVCILQEQDDQVVLDMNAPQFSSVSLAEIIEEDLALKKKLTPPCWRWQTYYILICASHTHDL